MRLPRLVAVSSLLVAVTVAVAAETLVVTATKTSIRADRQFTAATVIEASHDDTLELIRTEDDWHYVRFKGKVGWVHASAVAAGGASAWGVVTGLGKRVGALLGGGEEPEPSRPAGATALERGGGDVSQEDVALAGKGFNEQVEGEYRRRNPSLDYGAVDDMEKLVVPETAMAAFAAEGRLRPRRLE